MLAVHEISKVMIMAIGFTAQIFFSLRTLFQWWKSEKAKKVVSPSAYWVLSVIGSYLFFVYGILRDDFSIVLGQLISYYIYLWNLNAKGVWKRLGLVLQTVLLATPVVAVVLMLQNASVYFQNFFRNDNIPFWLVVFGSAGQVIFTLRFQPFRLQCHNRIRNLPSRPCPHPGTVIRFRCLYQEPCIRIQRKEIR